MYCCFLRRTIIAGRDDVLILGEEITREIIGVKDEEGLPGGTVDASGDMNASLGANVLDIVSDGQENSVSVGADVLAVAEVATQNEVELVKALSAEAGDPSWTEVSRDA